MANDQGTGRHPHKSSEEPYAHNEAPTTKGRSDSDSHSASSHDREGSREHESSRRHDSHSGSHESSSHSATDSKTHEADLKEREYRDKDGNIHHHTHTAAAMQEGESGNRKENESGKGSERESHRKAS